MKALRLWFIALCSGLFFSFLAPQCLARVQSDTTGAAKPDSIKVPAEKIRAIKDSLHTMLARADSLQGVVDSLADTTDSNHLVVAAIKSISGEQPEDEFFAAFWRFKYGKRAFSLANLDIALTNRPTDSRSDSVSSPQRRLTDAGMSFIIDLSSATKLSSRKDPLRSMGIGPYVKIFNEEAYYGIAIASVELSKSAFYSSYVQIAYLCRFYPVTDSTRLKQIGDGQTIRLANDNMFFEFFINSNGDNFFKYLAIRGGVLIPLTGSQGTFEDIQFRITVAVPVGGVFSF